MERSDCARQVWVFRAPSERWKTECIAPKKGQRGVGDGMGLLLEGKSWDFLSLCCEIGECKSVPQVAEYLALPVVQRINDTIGNAVFQQDNAPVHTESVVTEWFEQHNIQVDEHPPYSPDLFTKTFA